MNTAIISGGCVNGEIFFKECGKTSFDYIIAVDKGLEMCYYNNILPNIIVGDFDSVNGKILETFKKKQITVREYNPNKDATDTQLAIEHAIEIKSDKITIFGATGDRIDHMLGNLHIMCIPLKKGIECCILDEKNKISLINQYIEIEKNTQYGKYVSFIPLTSKVSKVTLKGFKYPLYEYDFTYGNSIGISNEIAEETAKVEIGEGILIMVQSKDK